MVQPCYETKYYEHEAKLSELVSSDSYKSWQKSVTSCSSTNSKVSVNVQFLKKMGIVQDNEKTQDLKEAEEIKQEAEVSQKKSNQSAKNEGEDKLKRKKKVNRFNSLFQSNIPQLKKMVRPSF